MTWFGATIARSVGAFHTALANADLRRLLLGRAGSLTGLWAYKVALLVYAYDVGGAGGVALVAVIQTVPAAIAAPFAALLADRYRRERVMVTTDVARAATLGAAGALILVDAPPGVVYALAAITGVLGTAFSPAERAIMPSLATTPDELVAANAASSTVSSVGSFGGPALGGLLLAATSTGVAVLVTAATFAWSALLVARIRTTPPTSDAEEPERGIVREVAAGFSEIATDRNVRLIIGLGSAQTLVRGALSVLVVVVALDLLEQSESGVGFLNSAIGVGGLAGVFVAVAVAGRRRLAGNFGLGILLWGAPIAVLGLWPNAVTALVLLGVVGLANTLVDVSVLTLLQRSVDTRVLARVFGVLETLITLTVGIGSAAAPLLVALLGPRGALIATGAVLPAAAALSWGRLAKIDAQAPVPVGLELLRAIPMFAPLAGPVLEQLAARLRPYDAPRGTELMREGEAADRFYVIERGEADVVAAGRHVRTLGPRDYFGEIALLRDVPRTATVIARTDLALYALERADFLAAVTGDLRSLRAAAEVVEERLAAGSSADGERARLSVS